MNNNNNNNNNNNKKNTCQIESIYFEYENSTSCFEHVFCLFRLIHPPTPTQSPYGNTSRGSFYFRLIVQSSV